LAVLFVSAFVRPAYLGIQQGALAVLSIIVTTYNRTDALNAVLRGLFAQTDEGFEIIVADDGSGPQTAAAIQALRPLSPVPLHHCWQEDLGFRAAAIRNRAAGLARGGYLVFLDGDCVPRRDFVAGHRRLARPGRFVPGSRILLNQTLTEQLLAQGVQIHETSFSRALGWRLRGQCNKVLPLLPLPAWLAGLGKRGSWRNAQSCNLGMWKEDLVAVNGFDELFEGWGYEDSDLVIRLLHQGVARLEGRFATPVFHLWHNASPRDRHDENRRLLQRRLKDPGWVRAERGYREAIQSRPNAAADMGLPSR
jgi:glycosyltransferase involved in cell wall biosynthesis